MTRRLPISITTALFAIGLLLPSQAWADGFGGQLVEGLCGGCGAGKALDQIHRDMGSPMDLPGKIARESVVEAAGPALAEAINQSRQEATNGGLAPIPPMIYQRLSRMYPRELLDSVKYHVGQGNDLSLQAMSFNYGDMAAITLGDVIVFRNGNLLSDEALWAHELKHAEQYRNWGVLDFAKRYVRDSNGVEQEAREAATSYTALGNSGVGVWNQQVPPAQFQNQPQAQFQPQPQGQSQPQLQQALQPQGRLTNVCVTNIGACYMNVIGYAGNQCYCNTMQGPVTGITQ